MFQDKDRENPVAKYVFFGGAALLILAPIVLITYVGSVLGDMGAAAAAAVNTKLSIRRLLTTIKISRLCDTIGAAGQPARLVCEPRF